MTTQNLTKSDWIAIDAPRDVSQVADAPAG